MRLKLPPLDGSIDGAPWLRGAVQQEEALWTAEAPSGWYRASRELSRRVGGQVWPHRGGLTWVQGSRVLHVLEQESYEHGLSARAVCRELGVPEAPTVGGCARKLLSWVGAPDPYSERAALLVGDMGFGYHDCLPGTYEGTTLYDVQSAYYTILSRLPSLRVAVTPRAGSLQFMPLSGDEGARWGAVLSAVAYNKLLRNTLTGAARGRLQKGAIYIGGRRKEGRALPGPYVLASILVVRSAWELCRQASHDTRSLYSCVDSVLSYGERPKVWERVGLNVRLVANGESDVCSYGVYRVGHKATLPYRRGVRLLASVERAPVPQREYYKEWLL